MLASLADAPLDDPQLVYEPKYDGIRAIAEVGGRPPVHLWSRLGNEKTRQFPEIAAALETWGRRLKQPVILDGEIIALDANGDPTGFQALQGRIHTGGRESFAESATSVAKTANDSRHRVAFIAFDILREGTRDLRDLPLLDRRAILERVFSNAISPTLRLSEFVRGNGRALYTRALSSGWEGLIAKHADSRYKSGKRTPDWRKLKIVQEQEFVIGGWTEPRQTRAYFGALLLGVYEPSPGSRAPSPEARGPGLVYAGHTGTGFNEKELARVMKLLKPLETRECPFRERPKTNETPHWVKPELVAQIKFTEWTADGKLRHPVYLGLRDDKKPEEVHREQTSRLHATSERVQGFKVQGSGFKLHDSISGFNVHGSDDLVEQLRTIEASRRDGVLALPGGERLNVSNLHKIFWPKQKLTKGDLLRYYVQLAPCILPAVDNRPLVMKRFPNGITGQPFYQHRAPDHVPPGVRVERVRGDKTVPSRFIGGSLTTLLYMTQLAAISQDPWFSRVDTPEDADYVALDLDPMPGVGFARVLEVARWIRDELDALGAFGAPKTSGADGLHIYIPLPPGTPYDTGLLFCQIVATVVANKHPKVATVERAVSARGKRVYVDYLQNIMGKTLATAYSARASAYAGVSTPLTWSEIDTGVTREDFTIGTVPERLREVGDLWKALRTAKGVDLSRVSKYAERRT
jgi:bifunctional non-homologous end joining protein LigD